MCNYKINDQTIDPTFCRGLFPGEAAVDGSFWFSVYVDFLSVLSKNML